MSNFDPYDHLGISLNPDGTLNRLAEPPTIAPNPDAAAGKTVVTKDINLDREKNTWLRIFCPTKLPSNDNAIARLPIVIYFHGGGFILYSTATIFAHQTCSQFASEIPAIVVSVNYRLAPENRLPAQYEDAVDAILWVKGQASDAKGEKWVKEYGDFSRCYLAGRGSGGNIAFFAALRALDLNVEPLKISGLVLNQPMFGGSQRTKTELLLAADQLLPLPAIDLLWNLALPEGTDRSHLYCNPTVDGPHKSKMSLLGRCLVLGFGGDPMIDWQQDFVTMLVMRGVQVEARFDEVGFHNVDMVDSRRASAILNIVREFVI